MKAFKKVLTLILAAACTVAIAAVATSCDNAPDEKKVYTIGISQLVTHDALDAATNAFMETVKQELGEENVEFYYSNAANDTATCTTIANDFVSKKVDLIMANATPALQAAASATVTIPILGTSVTEYGVALNIENFGGTVGGNVSGTSDLAPLTEQAQIALDLFPQAEKIGLFYCAGEANSLYQVQVVDKYLTANGRTCTYYSFTDSNDIAAVAERAASESDLIYIPTDNTVASCTEIVNNICLPKKVPIFGGDQGICGGCGTFTLAVSYAGIGRQTGLMAAQILKGEADIATMPVAYDPEPQKVYNPVNCEILGIEVPEGYVALEVEANSDAAQTDADGQTAE